MGNGRLLGRFPNYSFVALDAAENNNVSILADLARESERLLYRAATRAPSGNPHLNQHSQRTRQASFSGSENQCSKISRRIYQAVKLKQRVSINLIHDP